MMSELFFIVPHNEGQDMNYVENYKGDMIGATKRATQMLDILKDVLKQGTITIEVQDSAGEKLKEVV